MMKAQSALRKGKMLRPQVAIEPGRWKNIQDIQAKDLNSGTKAAKAFARFTVINL
jgi:hypothetical protein